MHWRVSEDSKESWKVSKCPLGSQMVFKGPEEENKSSFLFFHCLSWVSFSDRFLCAWRCLLSGLWKKRDGNDPIRSDAMLSSRDSFSHLETFGVHQGHTTSHSGTAIYCLSSPFPIFWMVKKAIISLYFSAHVRHHWSFMLHRTSRIDFTYFMLCSLL